MENQSDFVLSSIYLIIINYSSFQNEYSDAFFSHF